MLFGLAQSLRSLTASPITTALDQSRRQARRFLEAGGGVSGKARAGDGEITAFIVPADIELTALAAVIDEKLRRARGSRLGRSGDVVDAIGADAGGRLVVPAAVVRRLATATMGAVSGSLSA